MDRSSRLVVAVAVAILVAAPPAASGQQPPPATDPPMGEPPPAGEAPVPEGEYQPQPPPQRPIYDRRIYDRMWPRTITSWQEGQPIPPGYRPVKGVRKGLVIAGPVVLGSLYLITVVGALTNDLFCAFSVTNCSAAALYVPVIGPFIQMARGADAGMNVLLAFDGLGQVGGLAMLIVGVAVPRTVLLRNDLTSLRVAPMIGQGMSGAMLTGTF